jgi:hypothetical protein
MVCNTMMMNHQCLHPVKRGLLVLEVIRTVCTLISRNENLEINLAKKNCKVTSKNLEIFFLEISFSRFLVCMSKKSRDLRFSRYVNLKILICMTGLSEMARLGCTRQPSERNCWQAGRNPGRSNLAVCDMYVETETLGKPVSKPAC